MFIFLGSFSLDNSRAHDCRDFEHVFSCIFLFCFFRICTFLGVSGTSFIFRDVVPYVHVHLCIYSL
jgi:hypothetical protein